MADSVTSRLTRKVGPLPTWGWAALILVAYLLYNHFKGGNTKAANNAANPNDANPVPGFDAAGNMSGAYTPGTGNVYNYYYGDQNAAQAGGGGTGGSGDKQQGGGYSLPPMTHTGATATSPYVSSGGHH